MKHAEVHSLASYLADELAARGWQTEDAGVRMQTGRGAAHDILLFDLIMCVSHRDDRMVLTDDVFDGLSRAFDVSADMFRNLHSVWVQNPGCRIEFVPEDNIFGPTSRRALIRAVQ